MIKMNSTDLLIIGSGFAGLFAAITARDRGVRNVAIVDKGSIGKSSQSRLAAGATIYCLPQDDADAWIEDFVLAQNYLSRQEIIEDIIHTSFSRLEKLRSWGVDYHRQGLDYFRLPSRGLKKAEMMVLPKWKDKVGGSAVVGALLRQVKQRGVDYYPKILVTDLLKKEGRAAGAVGIHRITGEAAAFKARAVIMAGGDCSFRGNYACCDHTTGDAFRAAYDAGVRLSNMEFLTINTGSPYYGFEGTGVALRLGGRILNAKMKRFMHQYHPEGDAAECNFLVQAMADQVVKGDGPPFFLDVTRSPGKETIRTALGEMIGGWMPIHMKRLEEVKHGFYEKPQEWVPAVQTLRGGTRTDIDCMTDLPGLFAAGMSQALDPGLFNGWSSMRAMWAGERSGTAAAKFVRDASDVRPDEGEIRELQQKALAPLRRDSGADSEDVCDRMQGILFPYDVSIRRSMDGLKHALSEIERIRDNDIPVLHANDPHELVKAHETANMILSAELHLRASLMRRETRGDHFREDCPETDNADWLKWINITKNEEGKARIELEPVPLERYRFRPKDIEVNR